jgi:phosphohistidine phosphatase
MHQMILMRHAKAERARNGLADHDRRLAPEGRAAAAAAGARLRRLGIAPDVVLVSSARRTQETLASLGSWEDQPNIEILEGLYMAPPARLRDVCLDLRETVRSVLVLGHNPGIHELALSLAEGAESRIDVPAGLRDGFATASFAEFLVLTPWRELRPSSVRLQRYLAPQPSGASSE